MRCEPGELALRLLLRFGRHAGLLDRFLQLLDFRPGALGIAELLLNLTQTLAQHRLLLTFVEGLAGTLIDLTRNFQHLDALVEEREHPIEAQLEIEGRQDLLFLVRPSNP